MLVILNPRLITIADMVPKCRLVCDIGTDHAYLPIFLLEKRVCQKAIVTEINQGPLNIACSNISKKNLQNHVEAVLGDGIKALEKSLYLKDNKYEDFAIVIAGMGGNLIVRILEEGINYAQKAKTIILQPMSKLEIVYEWLMKHGFDIIDEELVKDGNKLYNVLAVKWTGIEKTYNPIDLYISRRLVEKKDPLLKEYIYWKISVLDKIITGLKNSKDYEQEEDNEKGYLARLINIKHEMMGILELLQ